MRDWHITGTTDTLTLLLNDALLDLDQPIKVIQDEKTLFEGKDDRTIKATALTLAQRGRPSVYHQRPARAEEWPCTVTR